MLDQSDYDFSLLKAPRKTSVTLCMCASKLDGYTCEFMAKHPGGVLVHLGCGLDSRWLRVGGQNMQWCDLDLPDVIDLRRHFYEETPTYRMIGSSVTAWEWLDQIWAADRPVLIVAEGLLMYLKEDDVRTLLIKASERFSQCSLVCDVFSAFTANRVSSHPSLKKTGAVIQWGIDDPHTMEAWSSKIRLREEWYFAQAPELDKLGVLWGFMFKLAGRFAVANKAHRILHLDLTANPKA